MMASDPKLKIIEEEQLQLKKYIEENYSKIKQVSLLSALEHLRKKIELSTEWIHAAKLREDEARKAFEAASKVVKDEEAINSNTQYARLEELKRRLEIHEPETKSVLDSSSPAAANEEGGKEHGQRPATAEGESKSRKKPQIQGRGRGIGIMNNKGRGGWTGAGFDVDVRT
ncbi:hypothetical protein Bca52824_058097 [Brassica carinata]|uniref:RAB6-interacting golgin n=1 Tax=Brassica carinata TaxID=52824 RepID=A0A8X7QSH5_BRACI|nr:hypothetical protein Bca52824_058097 [Brassica carinata]